MKNVVGFLRLAIIGAVETADLLPFRQRRAVIDPRAAWQAYDRWHQQVPTHKGERGGVSDSHFFFACFFRSRRRISNHVGFMFFGFFLHSS